MRERGDCDCLHEPFMYFYYVHQAPKKMPYFQIDPDHPVTFKDILSHFKTCAINKPVFAKDMAYYVVPKIFDYPELATLFNHVFLIRNPHRSIASYFQLDQEISSAEIGLNAQWELFQWVYQTSGNQPLVLSAEHVQSSPLSATEQLWDYLELPACNGALEWKQGEVPKDWEQVSTWHEKTLRTSGIQKEKRNEASAIQHFQTLASRHPRLTQLLADHSFAYQSLKAVSETQWASHTAQT
ncbi:MAG: hypothetical protein KTR32_33700 [Granulosicoccus sp.]|nr:hypothetical protein [Granulosicoccus sp.]